MDNFVFNVLKRRDAQVGLAIILFFVLVGTVGAALAPYKNTYNPSSYYVAAPDALPSWVKLFPGYSGLPPNIILPPTLPLQAFKTPTAVDYWTVTDAGPVAVTMSNSYAPNFGPSGLPSQGGSYTLVNTANGSQLITLSGDSNSPVYVYLTHNFNYTYDPPKMFYAQALVYPARVQGAGVAVFLFIKSSSGVYPIALLADARGQAALESNPKLGPLYTQYFANPAIPILTRSSWNVLQGITTASTLMPLAYLNQSVPVRSLPQAVFANHGEYTVGELIAVFPQGVYNVSLYQSDIKFQLFGSVYGLMGTDPHGADVASEFATSTSIALEIGFGSAAIVMVIGVLLGLVAGYLGGLADNVLLFVFDFLLLIPGLILLIDLDTTFTIAHITPNRVLLLIIILGVLGWGGVGRIVRSQVLTVKGRSYVQASQAMGGGNLYILRRHVLPHTAALIIALVTYIVPGLVIADAGLDFLSLGISQRPTWGNILANLINNMTPTNGYLWWIFIPVGLSIILISVGFYLVGTAIQEEFSRFT
ncbi:MAG: ABC transporter permease [Thermoprotei archaeon]